MLDRLHGPEAAKMEYKDLVQAYEKMRHEYNLQARGAKDVQARVLVELISVCVAHSFHFANSCKNDQPKGLIQAVSTFYETNLINSKTT